MREGIRAAVAAILLGTFATPATAIVDVAVSFEVRNVNETLVACVTDGESHTVSGRLVAPDSVPQAATLYLHGLGFGKFFWGHPGTDFAREMAELGHASVVIDRLGYDDSGKPNGFATCLGAQATVARQIAEALRTGAYTREDAGAPDTFTQVALAGHSAGGATAQIAAFSFPSSFDALAVLSWADQGSSNAALAAFADAAGQCLTGGAGPDSDEPLGGYGQFGRTDAEFEALMFHDADPGIQASATALRNRDPCGDYGSIVPEIVLGNLLLPSVSTPVLVLCGAEDAIFPPPACEDQGAHYTGTSDLTTILLDDIGHALTLEREAPAFRSALSGWLAARGF